MAIRNIPNAQNDRLEPVLTHHHKFSLIYTADAAGNFLPQTTQRIIFERGIDDNIATPWLNAGYSDPTVPQNSIDVTTGYKGGALSDKYPCMMLSVGFLPGQHVRVITADANNTTAAVRRAGGVIGAGESAMVDQLFASYMHGCFLQLLPPGNNTSCSPYLGIIQLLPSGNGFVNSSLMAAGQQRPEARYCFGTDIFVEPNPGSSDFNPNRIQLNFSTNVTSVEKFPNIPARAAGTLIVLDIICKLDFARVVFSKDPSGEESYDGVFDIDKRKINQLAKCV